MHLILFILFAGFCLAGAINLLLQSHPIGSALSLIVVMTSLAVLYLLLGAEFLAAAQVIVYAPLWSCSSTRDAKSVRSAVMRRQLWVSRQVSQFLASLRP
jgi:hypothetical protein